MCEVLFHIYLDLLFLKYCMKWTVKVDENETDIGGHSKPAFSAFLKIN